MQRLRGYKNKALLLLVNKHINIFYRGSIGSTGQSLLICYTNNVWILMDILDLTLWCVYVGAKWRNDLICGLENTVCVLVFPCWLCFTLETIPSLCVCFCTQPARLSGSRTAPRGSHIWHSQSCWRATRGGLERATRPLLAAVEEMEIASVVLILCVWERGREFSQAFLSLFLIFWLSKEKEMVKCKV